jgi:hypothetical protein
MNRYEGLTYPELPQVQLSWCQNDKLLVGSSNRELY